MLLKYKTRQNKPKIKNPERVAHEEGEALASFLFRKGFESPFQGLQSAEGTQLSAPPGLPQVQAAAWLKVMLCGWQEG